MPAPDASRTTYDCSPENLRILSDTFWTSSGWRTEAAHPAAAEFARAKDAGIMFDADEDRSDHDTWIARAHEAARQLTLEEVVEAFIASLGSRRLDLRSALSSYIVAQNLPKHPIDIKRSRPFCPVCEAPRVPGANPNLLNFERFRWGGVRKLAIDYVAFDLEQFARAPRLRRTAEDMSLARAIFKTIRDCPPATTAAKLAGILKPLPGNKAERSMLIGTLGIAGILDTPAHTGFADRFVEYQDRAIPNRHYIEDPYPICWWTAADGINRSALRDVLAFDL